jgi:hypothetical protein
MEAIVIILSWLDTAMPVLQFYWNASKATRPVMESATWQVEGWDELPERAKTAVLVGCTVIAHACLLRDYCRSRSYKELASLLVIPAQ